MAVVSSIMNPTLKDIVDRTAPDGTTAKIIEAAEISMPLLADASFIKSNDGDGHQTTIRTGLPELAERRYNQGIKQTKTTTMPVREQLAMLEDLSSVDAKLAEKSGNVSAYRASERIGKLQAGHIWLGKNFIYGSPALSPDTFMGIAPRLSDKSAASGSQIIDAGGTGSDNTSIYIVTWGGNGANLIYRDGTTAGFEFTDMTPNGPELIDAPVQSADRKQMRGYQDWMGIHVGLSLGDWQAAARVANIDVSDLRKDPALGGADLLDLIIDAKWALKTDQSLGVSYETGELTHGKTVIYVNRTVGAILERQARSDKRADLRTEQVLGRDSRNVFQLYYGDWPIKVLDSIVNTEARVV